MQCTGTTSLINLVAIIYACQVKMQEFLFISSQTLVNFGSTCPLETRKLNIMSVKTPEKRSGKIHILA